MVKNVPGVLKIVHGTSTEQQKSTRMSIQIWLDTPHKGFIVQNFYQTSTKFSRLIPQTDMPFFHIGYDTFLWA